MTWGIFKKDSVSDTVEKLQKEGWDDMLKDVKARQGTQPNGGSGVKQGTRYGGGKQKEDESEKRKEKNESVEQVTEAKEGDVVTINKPGHPLHGLKGHVFHSGKDRATVELHDKPKDYEWQSTRNVQVKHDELKVHSKNESVQVDEANEYKVYSNSHNNPEHHTKHSTLDSAKAELAKHQGGALYHKNKLYNKKTGMFESVEVSEAKVAATQSTRTELGKRPAKPLTGKDAEDKKKESDSAWERLMAYASSQGKPVKEHFEELEDGTLYDGSDMLGEAQARYSSSYQFTHKPGDAESEKKLSDLKAQHKGTSKRVVLQGRLGKDNPNAHKYSKAVWGKPGSASSGAHTHQRIKKADAAHHDVYVYDKADTEYTYDEIISEVLSADASAGKWISDFVKSDNPKFAGDSKEKRKERALAAYYAAQKNESTDYSFYAEYSEYIEEAIQQDVVKMGAKEIKHANMKDKQQDAEIMEPHSEGEAAFLDKHVINVTDDPTAVKQDSGTGNQATAPKGQGAGSYDGDSKLGIKGKVKISFKEAVIKGGTTETGGKAEDIDTEPKEKRTKKACE